MEPAIVIVGAGHAGDSIAAQLRQQGWTGTVTMVGDEPHFPYDRPPLSKAFLQGGVSPGDLALRPPGFYETQGVQVLRGAKVVGIDRARRTVELGSGATLAYEFLVLATGSRHRQLDVPGAHYPGVLQLRTLAEAERLKTSIRPGATVGIVGGGYIGLEAAASLLAAGVAPVVVEREQRVLARVASEAFAAIVHDLHVRRGTRIVVGAEIEAICPVTGIHLKDGSMVACETVLVGVGAVANDELAVKAGLACNDGVLVDDHCRTSDRRIYAIGDCCRKDLPGFGRSLRLESIPAAQEQAKAAAASITDRPLPPAAVPWFWSDQFDVRIQIAGLLRDVARSFTRRDPARESVAIYHVDDAHRLRAVEAINGPAEFVLGKTLVKSGVPIPPELEQAPAAEFKKALL